MKNALGLVEAAGLVGAVTAADAMVKAANVTILGLERAKGFGWTTIKVSGDVGAVQAAVQTGEAVLRDMGLYVAHKVIPRPGAGVVEAFHNDYTASEVDIISEDDVSIVTKASEPVAVPVQGDTVNVQEISVVTSLQAEPNKTVKKVKSVTGTTETVHDPDVQMLLDIVSAKKLNDTTVAGTTEVKPKRTRKKTAGTTKRNTGDTTK